MLFCTLQAAQRVEVHHRDIFTAEEVSRLREMDSYIDYVQRPMLPESWVVEIFHLVTKATQDALKYLLDEYEDIVTFRGHNYGRMMGEQALLIQKKGPNALEPIQYVGNPYLRRTGNLLVNP